MWRRSNGKRPGCEQGRRGRDCSKVELGRPGDVAIVRLESNELSESFNLT